MKQPTKEQLNDPKWWAMNAPEGATHVDKHGTFYKLVVHKMFSYTNVICQLSAWVQTKPIPLHELIERPEPMKEWHGMQDGLPPEGTECECYVEGDWFHAKVIGYDGPACVAAVDGVGYYGARNPKLFRPIQSERDKGINEAMSHIRQDWYTEPSVSISDFVTNAVAQLYDAGYRKQMSRAEANDVLMNQPFYVPAPVRRALLVKLGFKE